MSNDTILVIDDELHIRKFLRISLEANGYQITEACNGEEGLSKCADIQPALIILDLGLPDLDGRIVLQRLREWTNVPVIVLSVRSDEREKVCILDDGANDYVTKPFGISELLARIRVLLRSRSEDDKGVPIYDVGDLRIDFPARSVLLHGEDVRLSRKEWELLKLFVQNAGRVLTHQQILRTVWGKGQENQTHYLRVLVGHLRQKLEDNPASPLFIVTEPGVGYRFRAG
jgi:two-component system KDP operon response regulator KdpE